MGNQSNISVNGTFMHKIADIIFEEYVRSFLEGKGKWGSGRNSFDLFSRQNVRNKRNELDVRIDLWLLISLIEESSNDISSEPKILLVLY